MISLLMWVLAPSVFAGDSATPVQSWLGRQGTDPRVQNEMAKFTADSRKKMRVSYTQQFPQRIQALLAQASDQALAQFAQGRCMEGTTADFQESGFAGVTLSGGLNGKEEDFESQIIRVESTACLPRGTAQAALREYLHPTFRLGTIPFLSQSQPRGGTIQVEEQISPPGWLFLSDVHYLLENSILRGVESNLPYEIVRSRLVWNDPGYQPIYFQDHIATFVELPDQQGLGVHLIAFARGEDLGMVLRSVVPGRLAKAQVKAVAELQRRL